MTANDARLDALEEFAPVHDAIGVVSAVCDYARANDGRGFNAPDAWLGHSLAGMPLRAWTGDAALAAWDMLRKYRGQLAAAGIEYDQLPRPEGADELESERREEARERREEARQHATERREEARQRARERARQWRDEQYRKSRSYVRCDGDGEEVVLSFAYDPDLVAACRKIEGRAYDGATKTNRYPFTSLPDVIKFAEDHDIDVTPDSRALAAIAADRAAALAAQPRIRLDDNGTVIIDASLDPDVYQALKEANNDRPTWDPKAKAHRLPLYLAAGLLTLAEEAGLTVSDEARAAIREHTGQQDRNRAEASAFEAAPVPVPGLAEGLALKPQQYPVVQFALEHRRVLIGDDMGWGKTLSSLAAAAADAAYPAVVVCRPSLTLNWSAEIRRFFPGLKIYEASGTMPQPVPPGTDVIVIGSSALAAKPRKTETGGKEFGWVAELAKMAPKALIIDEGQDTKERTANRSQACEQLAADIIARDGLVMDLTGTAILNRPRELCQQLTILGRIHEFGDAKKFLWRYCLSETNPYGADYNGARNLIELHDRLRAWGIMIRRSDDSALGLPPCREHVLVVPRADLDPDVMAKYREAENDLLEFLATQARQAAERLGKDPDSAAVEAAMRAATAEHLVAINTLRQLAGQAKREYVTRWVRGHVNAGEKVMVAAHHRPEVDAYAAEFGGLKLQGGQSVTEKEKAKAAFQHQPAAEAPVISVAIGAGGVGHTLTAARIGIQAEQAWTPGETQQMKKRMHRIGQDRPVDYYVTVAEGTIDEMLWDVVTSKQVTLDAVLDGRANTGTDDSETSVVADLTWRLTQQGLGNPAPVRPIPDEPPEDSTPATAPMGAAAAEIAGSGSVQALGQYAEAVQPERPQSPDGTARSQDRPAGPAPDKPSPAPGRQAREEADRTAVAAQRALRSGNGPGGALRLIETAERLDPARSAVWQLMRAQASDRERDLTARGDHEHGRWGRRARSQVPGGCRYCGTSYGQRGDCPPVTCPACGSRQCGDNLDRCTVCAYGLLHPFDTSTGEPLICGYTDCGAPAVAAAPRIGQVCGGHLDRVTLAAQGARRQSLADWIRDKTAERDIGGPDLTWIGPGGPALAVRLEASQVHPGDRVYVAPRWLTVTGTRTEGAGRVVLTHGPVPGLMNAALAYDQVNVRVRDCFWVHRPPVPVGSQENEGGSSTSNLARPAGVVDDSDPSGAPDDDLGTRIPFATVVFYHGSRADQHGLYVVSGSDRDDGGGISYELRKYEVGWHEGRQYGLTGVRAESVVPLADGDVVEGECAKCHALCYSVPVIGWVPECGVCALAVVASPEPAKTVSTAQTVPADTRHVTEQAVTGLAASRPETSGDVSQTEDEDDEAQAEAWLSPRHIRAFAHRYLNDGLLPVPAWGARPNGECCCPRGADCDRPGKHPRSVRSGPGAREYSWKPLVCSTPAEIDERFADGSEYAAGNLMVAISAGMMAVDIDEDDGGRGAAAALAEGLGELPPTLVHKTPHGEHRVYRTPPGWTGRAWVGKDPANPVPAGIDLRMPGQILMAAPSRVPSPDGPAAYGPVTESPVAALPGAYLTAWTPARPQPRQPAKQPPVPPDSAGRAAKYVHDAMTRIAEDLAARRPGGRNAAVYAAGLKAGSLLGAARATQGAEASAWTDEQAEQALLDATRRNGYTDKDGESEALRAIRSGLRNGLRRPRTLPDFTEHRSAPGRQPERQPAAGHRDSQAQTGPRAAGRWQDLVPVDVRREVEAADRAAAARRLTAVAAHQQAVGQHDRAATTGTAAEVERTRAEAHAAHREYTTDGRHVTGRHDAAMLRWAASITAQREQPAREPRPDPAGGTRGRADAAAAAANQAYQAGNLDQAREHTDQAAEIDPSRADLWQRYRDQITARRAVLAARQAYQETGDRQQAEQLLEQTRLIDPRTRGRALWDNGLPALPAVPRQRQAGQDGLIRQRQRQPASQQPRPQRHQAPARTWPAPPTRREPGAETSAIRPEQPEQPASSPQEPRTGDRADPDDPAARGDPSPWPAADVRRSDAELEPGSPRTVGSRRPGTPETGAPETGADMTLPVPDRHGTHDPDAGMEPEIP